MHDVYVGVGSNIDPEANLHRAIQSLSAEFGDVDCSNVYRSPALGFSGPDFLNLVLRFSTDATPMAIEEALSRIERAGGRSDLSRSGSRTLDLDLLLYAARVAATDRLPREDILRYPFVLAPLNDLAPDLPHPLNGVSVARALEEMREQVDMPVPVEGPAWP